MAYSYHISFNDGVSYMEFYPSNYPKVTYSEYAEEIFLRPTINEIKISKLLNEDVYNILYSRFFNNAYFASQIKFLIKRNGITEYSFRSSVSNAKIDTEKKLFMISPEADDAYQNVLDKYDTEIDINTLLTDTLHPYLHVTNSFVNVDFTTFADIDRNVEYTNTTGAVKTARLAFASTGLGSGDKVKVVIRNLSYTNLPPRMNVANSTFTDISNVEEITADGIYTLTLTSGAIAYIELTQDAGDGNGTGSFDYEIYYYLVATSTKSKLLDTLLDNFLGVGYMATGIAMRSTYLFNDALPPEAPAAIDIYITANPTHNYVSEAVNRFNGLHLAEVDGLTTDAADDHKITFEKLMQILRYKLRAYWYIDTEGYLRIEHEKYFRTMAAQMNVTSNTYTKFKPEVDIEVYNYEKSDIYSLIQYEENNESNADFIADPIEYNYIKTSTKKKDINVQVSTDLSYIVNNPDDAAVDGFLLVETEEPSIVIPIFGASRTSGYYYQNQYLSWYSLFPIYFKYFGEADSADINNGTTLTLDHVKEFMRQVGIKFYYGSAINWYQPVTLMRGTGWIKKIEHDLSSGFYTLDVGFSPATGTIAEDVTADSTIITVDSTLITADET